MNSVMGVELSRIDESVVLQSYRTAFQKEPPKAVDEALRELAGHFFRKGSNSTRKEDRLMECDECGGSSPASLDSCPFCGSADEDAGEVQATSNPAPKPPQSEKSVKKTTPKAATSSPKLPPVELVERTSSDLDDAVARINRIKTEGGLSLYRLGSELRQIYDNDLWKQRSGADGKPSYKTFAQFLEAEVQIHKRTVFRMMEVAKEYSLDQANKYGTTILRGLLSAPKEDRAELLEKVDAGEIKGKRGLEAEVQKIRERKGVKVVKGAGKTKSGHAASAASAKKAEKARRKIVTVAFPVGRKTIKLFARPAKKGDPEKPARAMTDFPWGKIECQNGVTIYANLQKSAKGELELMLEARRES